MPFTFAHGAAALPFRRSRLILSALVVGTLAPDFEYFVRLAPDDGFGHTLRGAFILTLPLALVVLWMFHTLVKPSTIALLPERIRARLFSSRFRFGGLQRFLLITASILVGIATHVLWDSFTHPRTWVYRHWSFLQQTVLLPVLGPTPVYKVFQHASTIIGIGILLGWFAIWYRQTKPFGKSPHNSAMPKIVIIACLTIVALIGGIARGLVGTGFPLGQLAYKKFLGEVIVTVIALLWWQLVVYGVVLRSGLRREETSRIGVSSQQSPGNFDK